MLGKFRSPLLGALITVVLSSCVSTTVGQDEFTEEQYRSARLEMVRLVIRGAGIKNERVIKAMEDTPRHEFVQKNYRAQSYLDAGLPIGEKQTISSPFIVAFMTESLDPQPDDRVLEIGTGSGFQAAVLSPLVSEVFTIEIVESLGRNAERVLRKLDYKNVKVKIGDGYQGWPEYAPFDKIIVTCSPETVPQPLVDQLTEGGMMVVPVGERYQQTLYLFKKEDGKLVQTSLRPTLFVPMTGQAEGERERIPDPANPVLLNSGFEEGTTEDGFVKGWYYDRQVTWRDDDTAPEGDSFVEMSNSVPGQAAHLLQGIPIDGLEVSKIRFGGSVKYQSLVKGPGENDVPIIAITFYDKNRKDIVTEYFGPFSGTQSSWKHFEKEIRVPVASREAILRIGLFGATGTIAYDKIVLEKIQ